MLPVAHGPARASVSELCDAAAERAARETGMPRAVLLAIARAETGRNREGALAPWPWTVNMEGAGRWFDSESGARAFVDSNLRRGAESFDVGCFQINFKWHGAAFESIDEMFDPLANARYAAAFLVRLHAELGDWSLAAGAYHSRTEAHARPYRARFERILATVSGPATGAPASPPLAAPDRRRLVNSQASVSLVVRTGAVEPARNGSLVPLGAAQARFLPIPGGL